jgi:flagellar M-ring protein FliF
VNAAFRQVLETAEVPFWKDPGNIPFAVDALKWLVVVGLALATLLILRSAIRDVVRLSSQPAPEPVAVGGGGEREIGEETYRPSERPQTAVAESEYERNLRQARELARDNPRLVAQVIKTWVTQGE